MKKIRTVLAAVMAAAMVFTMTACDEETPTGSGGGGSAPTTSGGTSDDKSAGDIANYASTDEKVISAVKDLVDDLSFPDLKPTKRIRWLSWYNIDETSPAAELFKAAYGIPTTGDDATCEGQIFELIYVKWDNRYERLSELIAAGDSPDIFPFEVVDFPYGVLNNRYQAVDDIVDLTAPKWQAAKDIMSQFELNGKHYAAFWEITLSQLLWYRDSVVKSIGAEDPQELFNQGKWDWDAMLEISRKFQASGTDEEPRFAIDGFSVPDNFVVTTGVPMIGNNGKELVNNLHNPAVERAMTGIIATMQKENLRYPRHEINNYDVNYRAWFDGKTLFLADGTWRYEEDLKDYKKRGKWSDDEIKVVPYPKDPQADKHYVQVKADPYMWCKGSENKAGVQAWIDCCATAAMDPITTEVAKEGAINNEKRAWTAQLLDFLYPLYKLDGTSPVTPIVEFKTGLGPSVYDSMKDESAVACLTGFPWLTGEQTYVQLREENEGAINQAIKDINSRI